MKTYCESKGREVFDWHEALDAVDKYKMSSHAAFKMKSKADSWSTCACGNLCDAIPRVNDLFYGDGCPDDPILANLGSYFFTAISDIAYSINQGSNPSTQEARDILDKIEKRSVEMGVNLKNK